MLCTIIFDQIGSVGLTTDFTHAFVLVSC